MSESPVCYRRFALEDQKLAIYKVAYGGMLIFNIYTLVVIAFGLAVAALRRDVSAKKLNRWLMASVVLMFLATTALCAGALYNVFAVATYYLSDLTDDFEDIYYTAHAAFTIIQAASFVVSVTLGQAIILWRTIVISEKRKWVIGLAVVLELATIGVWITAAVFNIMIISATASFAVNVICTIVIVSFTRLRAKVPPSTVNPSQATHPSSLERLLAIGVESGIFYSGLWMITLIGAWAGPNGVFFFLMQSIMSVVVALHPLLLVILYAARRTVLGGEQATRRASAPAARRLSDRLALRNINTPSASGPDVEFDDTATIAGSVQGHGKGYSIDGKMHTADV